MKKHLPFAFFIFLLLSIQTVHATAAGDYRSAGSGDWSVAANWKRFNGTAWVTATLPPSATDGIITISTGDSISVSNTTDTTFADQLVVNEGAILDIATPAFVLLNGPATDMTVKGKLVVEVNAVVRVRSQDPLDFSYISYLGDTIVQRGGLSPSITFHGANPQFIFGTGYFGPVTLNNAGNVTIKEGNSFGITTFVNGKLIAEGFFVVDQYNIFKGVNSTRFIEGKILFITGSSDPVTFTFPAGIGNRYLPFTFTSQKSDEIETHYILSLIAGAPPANTAPAAVDRVLGNEYLHIESQTPGNLVNASVRLSYDSTDHVADTARLKILKSDGAGNWINVGGHAKGLPGGKITSAVGFNVLGDFVLADVAANILPVNGSVASANINLPDVYKLNLNGDGKVRLRLVSKNDNPVSLQLLDGDSLTAITSLSLDANASGNVVKDGLAKGLYYVKIWGANTGEVYRYTLGDSIYFPQQANNTEPDSTKTLARMLRLNSDTTGHLGYYYKNRRDTADWYKINTTAAGQLKLSLTSANSNSILLNLFDNAGTSILGTFKTHSDTANTLTTTLPKGSYYVMLTSVNSNLFEPYTLSDNLILTPPGFTINKIAVSAEESLEAGNTGFANALVYPNPAPKQFRIQLNGVAASGIVILALKDVTGKTVWSSAKTSISSLNSLAVDVSTLPNGIYFLQITGEDKKVFTKKVIVSR